MNYFNDLMCSSPTVFGWLNERAQRPLTAFLLNARMFEGHYMFIFMSAADLQCVLSLTTTAGSLPAPWPNKYQGKLKGDLTFST